MTTPPQHLLIALSLGNGNWTSPEFDIEENHRIGPYLRRAHVAEDNLLHFVFLADNYEFVPSQAAGYAGPSLDPIALLAALSAHTSRVGLVATISTTFGSPYIVARQLASLDHLSAGRAAWNVVAAGGGQEKFGQGELADHPVRYARGKEFLDVVTALWDSWEADAVVVDKPSRQYADVSRIHEIDHIGEHFTVRGALPFPRSPQGHPLIFQAGSSPAGVDLAAIHADLVFTAQPDDEGAIAFRSRLRARAVAYGRGRLPAVLPGLQPVIGRTDAEAQERLTALHGRVNYARGRSVIETRLGGIDLSDVGLDDRFPVDRLPKVENLVARRTRFAFLSEVARREGATLRDVIDAEMSTLGNWVVAGTVEQIADRMTARADAGGADGYVLMTHHLSETEERELIEELIPALQRRGVFRTEPAPGTVREQLGWT